MPNVNAVWVDYMAQSLAANNVTEDLFSTSGILHEVADCLAVFESSKKGIKLLHQFRYVAEGAQSP